jgi:galactonate dehydratase
MASGELLEPNRGIVPTPGPAPMRRTWQQEDHPLKIARIDAYPIRLPEGDSFGGHGTAASTVSNYSIQPGWKGIYSSQIETLIVRVETETGIVGWGEGQSPIAPEVAGAIVEKILAPILLGRDATATHVLWEAMYGLMNVRGHTGGFMMDAIAAIDLAVWDIKGKALGVSVASLLGGPARTEVPCYVSGVRGRSTEERLAGVRNFAERGFADIKVFGGFGLAEDIRLVEELSSAAGTIAFDGLWNYTRTEALQLGRALERLGCRWFEAPVDGQDIAGHAELARALDMPIAGGETARTCREFQPWIEQRALDLMQPDIGRCGITEGVRIIDQAQLHNLTTTLHCGIASPVMIAASLQVAAARNEVAMMEYQPVVVAAANRLLVEPLHCEGGRFRVPQGAGLGIDVDEAVVKRLTSRQSVPAATGASA